jgi:hypothetical protein
VKVECERRDFLERTGHGDDEKVVYRARLVVVTCLLAHVVLLERFEEGWGSALGVE